MKKILAVLALAAACPAFAANYYVSDCLTGAVKGCKPGSDSSLTPTNPKTPYRTITKAFATFRNAAAGDKILFARGGSFSINGESGIQNFNASAANPIIFGSYAPTWYTGAQRPILTQLGSGPIFAFTDGGTPEADGGYIVRDLHLKGNIARARVDGDRRPNGITTSQLTSDITLDNLILEGFELALYCGDDIPRVKLINSKLIHNRGAGILTSCDHILIENNEFDDNGYGHVFLDHQIYLSGSPNDGAQDVTVRGNSFKNSVHFGGNACTGSPLVGHGKMDGVLIENNQIIEKTQAGGGCWGISIDGGYGPTDGQERFSNVVIRGNLLVNVGNTGISCSSCDNWTIENNVLVWQFRSDAIGIGIPSNDLNGGGKLGDYPTTQVTIRNNSLYYKTSSRDAIAIKTAEQGNFTVSSNLIFFGESTNGLPHCFDTSNRNLANFDDFSNNLCFGKSGATFSESFTSQAIAEAAGWNTDGSIKNPKLLKVPSAANKYSLALKAVSPGINAGNASNCSPTDFGGELRNSHCDMGAYEYIGQ